MTGWRNVYRRDDIVFVGRFFSDHADAVEASNQELRAEPATELLFIAIDTTQSEVAQ